jgi:signal peptidase II
MTKKIFQTGLFWWWVTLLVLLIDRFTKVWIQHSLSLYDSIRITSFFNVTLAYNKGAAFSFLNSASGWQSWLFGVIAVVVSVVLIVWLKRLSRQQKWLSIALTLIIGGALGNLWDRLSYGYVIDFIQVHWDKYYWPVFNGADSAICLGAAMLVLESLFKSRAE